MQCAIEQVNYAIDYSEISWMYENTAWSAMAAGKKTKVMRVPVPPRLDITKAGGTHLQTAQL
ncbi:hypothetical protein QUA56_27865 [Microcoleus sp. N3A4]|uniref:hypothetical protein n=1 Tax=Microcoleus sp. N3A4 TaxID=3055379 RepID=UPI002FD27F89